MEMTRMPRATTRRQNVQFLVDERGRRKSVLMSYRTYRRLLEDIEDLQAIEDRKDQTPEDLENVIAELKDAGRI
jgi:hypothetical protein